IADAFARMNSGDRVAVYLTQNGPGSENSFGGLAQAWSESAPMVAIPGGYARAQTNVAPNFSGLVNFQHVSKWTEQLTDANDLANAVRRAFTHAKNGRQRPVVLEIPGDLWGAEIEEPINYTPTPAYRSGPDPADARKAAQTLVNAERPVIYAGQGVHYAKAWDQLKELAELLEAPVTTSLQGKSAFPETHPLSLGSGGRAFPKAVHEFLRDADVVFGIGCSFAKTGFGLQMPKGPYYIHSTLDPEDFNNEVEISEGVVGDAALVLDAIIGEVRELISGPRGRADAIAAKIAEVNGGWRKDWAHKTDSNDTPVNPYRALRDLHATLDETVGIDNVVATHDAGSPRDQMSPFWNSTTPLSYIGWGKTTQLGTGLGYAMGAKVSDPEKTCLNVWGDAAIGMTGMDFETAVRENIPILSVLLNNFSMAIELPIMKTATEKYRATDISGHYADMAKAFGGYGERVESPADLKEAFKRGIRATEDGQPALIEVITSKEIDYSVFR
ncbi:MAG: thiamine pyrophosphate-requiring protein, partial [Chloroflexota bacterium]|nr:thiamine pyrophosphate-requiring protein [Chloroflexota bacterium]